MKTNSAVKKNISGMQVLKTLQVMLEDNYTMEELVQKLNEKEKEPIFNNSVISKYINTCRFCGIDILKIHNKYFVASIPFGLDLNSEDIDLIENLQEVAAEKLSLKQHSIFNSFIRRLSKFSNKHIIRVEKKTEELVDKLFEKAIQEKRRINMMFKVKATIECIPLEIINCKNKKSFKIIHNGKEKIINADRVAAIEVIGKKFTSNYIMPEPVLYKLYGDLAKRYTLKDNEVEVNRNSDFITISCQCDDMDSFITRLLRYDSCCEILGPQIYRDTMKKTISEMLANYGE